MTAPVDFWSYVGELPGARPGFALAVCGGRQYGAADRGWVVRHLNRLTAPKRRTHGLTVYAAGTCGAARIAWEWGGTVGAGVAEAAVYRFAFGRAAEFRAAWALVTHAHGLVVFEPADLIARYAIRLAGLVEGDGGRPGVRVIRVPPR